MAKLSNKLPLWTVSGISIDGKVRAELMLRARTAIAAQNMWYQHFADLCYPYMPNFYPRHLKVRVCQE